MTSTGIIRDEETLNPLTVTHDHVCDAHTYDTDTHIAHSHHTVCIDTCKSSSTYIANGVLFLLVSATVSSIIISQMHSPDSNISNDSYADADLIPNRVNFPLTSPNGVSASPYSAMFMPMYTTHPLDVRNDNISSVVIPIHGYSRNAEDYFRTATNAVGYHEGVLVITPVFSRTAVRGSDWENKPTVNDSTMSVHWNTSSWMRGGNATPYPYHFTSSFHILDDLVNYLLSGDHFPYLQRITFAGYSAGSQLVSHFAWASDIGYPPSIVRFLLSGSSMYLYLSPIRPHPSCWPLSDQGASFSCDSFELPSNDYLDACPGYDSWKYGVSEFPSSGYSYLEKYVNNEQAVKNQTANLRLKDIHYVLGDADVCNCNTEGYQNPSTCFHSDSIDDPSDDGEPADDYIESIQMEDALAKGSAVSCSPSLFGSSCCDTYPDSENNLLSRTCGSNMQGANRFQRGLLYLQYLGVLWQDYNYTPPVEIVHGMGHDREKFFNSDKFQNLAYIK